MSGLLFFFLKSMGKVRVSAEDEAKGMDETHHGGKAYEYMKDEICFKDLAQCRI